MYDVAIIGGGPAGLSAGMYTCRSGLKTILFEKMFIGGQLAFAYIVENYPGFDKGISGPELANKLERQAKKFGLEALYEEVRELQLQGEIKKIITDKGTYEAKTILLCMGSSSKLLGLPKEDQFRGAGVSYCATCDGAFFRDMDVAVVGGGDTAVEDALYLSRFVNRVYLVHRRHELRASRIVQDRAFANDKITILWDTVIEEILGVDKLTGLRILNTKTGEKKELELQGLFIAIGIIPDSHLVKELLPMSEGGFIPTDANMKTNIPGIFAAGDIRLKSLLQIVTAASDGAIAAMSAEHYIYGKIDAK